MRVRWTGSSHNAPVALPLGAFGTVLSCSGMIVAAIAGGAGAATTGAVQGGSMAGMSTSASNPGWVTAINSVGKPLLVLSLLLVIVGLAPRGLLPTILGIAGAILFYAFMFPFSSLPLTIVAAQILVAAYVAAYWPPGPVPLLCRSLSRR